MISKIGFQFLALAFLWLLPSVLYSQSTWQDVGSSGFSDSTAAGIKIAFDNSGVPYVAFRDGANNSKATVMKYNAAQSSWSTVGSPGFSHVGIVNISLAFDSNNDAHVAFSNDTDWKASVMMFDRSSSQWVSVGALDFTPAGALYNDLLIDDNDEILLVHPGIFPNEARVSRYTPTNPQWTTLGASGLTQLYTTYNAIALSSNNDIYIAFISETAVSKGLYVMKYDKSNQSWTTVGGSEVTTTVGLTYIDLLLDDNDTPFVAFTDEAYNGKATVKRYNSNTNSWVDVGTGGFSIGVASAFDLEVNSNNDLFISYSEYEPGVSFSGHTVMQYDQGQDSWQPVGTPSFQLGAWSSFAFDDQDIPYIACTENTSPFQAKVMKYDERVGIEAAHYPIITVFPNPAAKDIVITSSIELKVNQVLIYDISGRVCYSENVSMMIGTMNLSVRDLPSGNYLVSIIGEDMVVNHPIIVQH